MVWGCSEADSSAKRYGANSSVRPTEMATIAAAQTALFASRRGTLTGYPLLDLALAATRALSFQRAGNWAYLL
jgi:hypothetical protein